MIKAFPYYGPVAVRTVFEFTVQPGNKQKKKSCYHKSTEYMYRQNGDHFVFLSSCVFLGKSRESDQNMVQ